MLCKWGGKHNREENTPSASPSSNGISDWRAGFAACAGIAKAWPNFEKKKRKNRIERKIERIERVKRERIEENERERII